MRKIVVVAGLTPMRSPLTTLKAALAAAFAYHEIRLVLDDGRCRKTQSALFGPQLAVQTRLSSLRHG